MIDTSRLSKYFAEHMTSAMPGTVFYLISVHPDGSIMSTCATLQNDSNTAPSQDSASVLGRATAELVALTLDLNQAPEDAEDVS